MPARIVPVAKALYLCDYQCGYENNKTDLYGIFNAIRPPTYPFTLKQFCVYAQLVGGLREVPFHIEVVFAAREEIVRTTDTRTLRFPNRSVVVEMVCQILNCRFAEPGLYLVELWCENTCIADVPVLLRGTERK